MMGQQDLQADSRPARACLACALRVQRAVVGSCSDRGGGGRSAGAGQSQRGISNATHRVNQTRRSERPEEKCEGACGGNPPEQSRPARTHPAVCGVQLPGPLIGQCVSRCGHPSYPRRRSLQPSPGRNEPAWRATATLDVHSRGQPTLGE